MKACKLADKKRKNALKTVVGLIAGFINGLFGGGGGMIVVPCLKYLLKYETDSAHATAIAVILPLSVLSGIFYAAFGNVVWEPTLFTTIGVTVGGIMGAVLLKKLSPPPITLIFSAVMAIAGVKMLLF
ncbi:MAG: sulfite exporter TauE/SafE family protein [Christensenellaceae bacterium]